MHEPALRAAAFGSDPLPDPAVLRGAGTPRERLLAAIVLGAQGRYAAAAALLERLRGDSDPVTASLAASTLASHRRQLGGHRQARALDGEAFAKVAALTGDPDPSGLDAAASLSGASDPDGLDTAALLIGGLDAAASLSGASDRRSFVAAAALSADPAPAGLEAAASLTGASAPAGLEAAASLSGDPGDPAPGDSGTGDPDPGNSDPDGLDAAGARADALLGLAADNLALGRLTAARRLAARAAEQRAGWRAGVRGGWVGAEIELAAGQGAAAVPHAERAFETAVARDARRHAVKSGIVLAVAVSAAGCPDHREISDGLVGNAMATAEECELLSLLWPAALVAADLRPGHAEEYRFRVAQVLHAVLRSADPCGRRIAGESPWVPDPGG
ncbi:hypothetical protein MUY14_32995 [Amycolatopsis sp. FBCC-B4732]|nr:hypothetical protein [Amycolatopsis sp. FBCC-B4732]UOX86541.1 hypothetical protein MUY14_32995 [Amycolatopsis sp. FBCC-B4732]